MSILESFLQNPQMVAAIATRCGIDPAQASAAIQQFAPALATGLHAQLSSPDGSEEVKAAVAEGTHQSVASDPSALAAHNDSTTQNMVSHLLGGQDATAAIANKVSQATGIDPQTLARMLPTLAAVVMGAAATHSAASGGLQGLLGSLAQSAQAMGGGNSLLGGLMGAFEKKSA